MKNTKIKSISIFLFMAMIFGMLSIIIFNVSATPDTTVSYYEGVADTTWYSEGHSMYFISSAAQLAGLAQLVNEGTTNFKDSTVYLNCDIVWNDGDASNWGTTAPTYSWTPIGVTGSGNSNSSWKTSNLFLGSFNGQGHVISGLYFSNTLVDWVGLFSMFCGPYMGNVSVVNSYFAANARIGALAGIVYGTTAKNADLCSDNYTNDYAAENCDIYENLYSNAYIVSSATSNNRSGGIFGLLRQDDTAGSDALLFGAVSVMRNCWSNATVTGPDSATYIGGMTANITGASVSTANFGFGDTLFINCLSTASISGAGSNAGGFCTEIYRTDAHFINCISTLRSATVTDATSGAFAAKTTYSSGFGGRIFTEGGYVIYPTGISSLISSATSESDNYASVQTANFLLDITNPDTSIFNITGDSIALLTVRTSTDDSYTTWLSATGYTVADPAADVTTAPVETETTAPETTVAITTENDVTTSPVVATTTPTTTQNDVATTATTATTETADDTSGCSCGSSSIFIALVAMITSSAVMIFTKKKA